ncbi:hypothetical protein AGMMS49949_08660 [Alphaproteobacteria bacterium]|nr:hypothetical protein AGMMS49949_08660 [Alphaproteobacteria bacterium]GHS99707.1 hypothetical protein AGMMS50296_7940 [Alphaproteobacteria bacterium]
MKGSISSAEEIDLEFVDVERVKNEAIKDFVKKQEQEERERRQREEIEAKEAQDKENAEKEELRRMSIEANTYTFKGQFQEFPIKTGDLIAFGGNGTVSQYIRKHDPHPDLNILGITHVGIALVGTGNDIRTIIQKSCTEGGLNNQDKKRQSKMVKDMKDTFRNVTKEKSVFCFHSTGVGVHISLLEYESERYDGNIFIRPLLEPVFLEDKRVVREVVTYLGKPYAHTGELFKSLKNRNFSSSSDAVFCSQLVYNFYRLSGLIDLDAESSNVLPSSLVSTAGADDLLKAIAAAAEIPLKIQLNYKRECFCTIL